MREILAMEDGFPERLREIPDSPKCIYLIGSLPEKKEPTVGIIGARNGTEYGKKVALSLARELVAYGIGIVSGMAYGIDSAAHRGALEGGGKTYAVLGSGADVCYPAVNQKLYEEIAKTGGIISEYAPGAPPLPHHFVERNRLIAGLSDILIVVEARERSGTFITVDRALEQGKQVFAVPGRISDVLSKGCNKLLMEGAGICLSKDDILHCFSIEAGEKKQAEIHLNEEENKVYQALCMDGKHIDCLVKELKMSVEKLYPILIGLELSGYCESKGNTYSRRSL